MVSQQWLTALFRQCARLVIDDLAQSMTLSCYEDDVTRALYLRACKAANWLCLISLRRLLPNTTVVLLTLIFGFDFLCEMISPNLIPRMKRIQTSGAQNRRKKRLREAEDNVMRGFLDVWVKKQYVAKDRSDAENRELVTVVQDGVSNSLNTELDIGGDNQDENSSQKSIPHDAGIFAEVSANVEASTVTLNDDAEGNYRFFNYRR